MVTIVFPSGAVEILNGSNGTFVVNGQRLKHYFGQEFSPIKEALYLDDWKCERREEV